MKPKNEHFFHVPFPPTSNTMYRKNKYGAIYKTSNARLYQDDVACSHWNSGKRLHGDLGLELEFFYPNNVRRDLDNCLKVLLDALTAARIWKDDCQVKHIEATVNPNIDQHGGRVHVRVWEL